MTKPRVLIVYYSRTGTTRKIAATLAKMLKCDIDEIVETRSRTGVSGYLRSLLEALRKRPSDCIGRPRKLPAAYEVVVIATPVWVGSVSSPVRAYLEANNQQLPQVAFLCTMGGSDSARTFAQMEQLVGKAPCASCAIKASEAGGSLCRQRLQSFVKALPAARLRAA